MFTLSNEVLLWCFTNSPLVSKSDIPSTICNLIFATPAGFRLQSKYKFASVINMYVFCIGGK